MPAIWESINNRDNEMWLKWFGDMPSSDDDVYSRLLDAATWMETQSNYNILCCKNKIGSCRYCDHGTAAYVTAYYQGDVEINNNYIRMCDGWIDDNTEMAVGFTLFHEMIHMVSAVKDVNGAYSKHGAHILATNVPAEARMSANNYMLYAA